MPTLVHAIDGRLAFSPVSDLSAKSLRGPYAGREAAVLGTQVGDAEPWGLHPVQTAMSQSVKQALVQRSFPVRSALSKTTAED